MRFCWSTLYVEDLEQSIDFYIKIIGLKLKRKFQPKEDIQIAFLTSNGDAEIELIEDKNKKHITMGSAVSWGFEVENLDNIIRQLSVAHIPIESGPIQLGPLTRCIFIKDPNNFSLQIVEQN